MRARPPSRTDSAGTGLAAELSDSDRIVNRTGSGCGSRNTLDSELCQLAACPGLASGTSHGLELMSRLGGPAQALAQDQPAAAAGSKIGVQRVASNDRRP